MLCTEADETLVRAVLTVTMMVLVHTASVSRGALKLKILHFNGIALKG
jgi:hypothetical protein